MTVSARCRRSDRTPSFMPSIIQVGLAMSLRCRAGPRLGGGLDAAAVAELPVVGVDVDDGDAQAS